MYYEIGKRESILLVHYLGASGITFPLLHVVTLADSNLAYTERIRRPRDANQHDTARQDSRAQTDTTKVWLKNTRGIRELQTSIHSKQKPQTGRHSPQPPDNRDNDRYNRENILWGL